MMIRILKMYGFIGLIVLCFSCNNKIIFKDDFKGDLNTKFWKVETKEDGKAFTQKGYLVMDTRPGMTVWLNLKLEGNYKITYDRVVVLDSGKNDRLSDLNQFWMADSKPFSKDGVFEEYDYTKLYYMGYGGNYNTTTRFRKYEGDGVKPVLAEYLASDHLLKPNHVYKIETTFKNGRTTWTIDGEKLVDYTDFNPLKEGYFGFRTTWSRQKVGAIKIVKL